MPIRHLLFVLLLVSTSRAVSQTAPTQQDSIVVESDSAYQPITGRQRLKWFVRSTVGPESLGAGMFSAAIGTARNSPKEYGGTWEGFGKRYGMRLTGVSTGNALEAGLGTLWGEDPRYFHAVDRSIKGRIGNVMWMTFAARRPDGGVGPAYARYAAIAGNNFLSNTWRADSETGPRDAAMRTLWGFLGRIGSNAFKEFWPDVEKHLFHRRRH